MKKSILIALIMCLSTMGFSQMNKADVESIFSNVDLTSRTNGIYIHRKFVRQNEKWENKYEKLDAATAKITAGEGGLIIKGNTYTIYLNYTNIKSINIWAAGIDIYMVD